MPGGGQDHEKTRDQLRSEMLADEKTYEQIATAMVEEFQDRRLIAWRNAHGWTQDHVADLFNAFVGDPRCPMKGTRISDFERWPNGGSKPTPLTLAILAENYGTHFLNLVDELDRQNMSLKEQAALTALENQFASVSDNARRSKLSLAYAASMGPQQLPSTPPYFVGRTEELDKLTAQLNNVEADGPVVITAIGGTAGIGKTALAVKWAQKHIDRFPDGQLYVNLRGFHPTGTPMAPQEAIRGFLDAFDTPVEKIPVGLDAQVALYRSIVKDKKLVVVLDNARDTDQVRPLLPGSPTCMVLITSRQRLTSLADESEGATHITLGYLTTAEAHQLLTKIFGQERIQAEPKAVDELIERCVHLPIALRIAARRVKAEPHTSLIALIGQLREERQRLTALSTGDSLYFDIRAVFSWSYSALSTGAARLLRLLGLHPGPDINALAAASLAGLPEPDTRELLTELLRAYLLEEPAQGRYQFHDLLNAYASEQAVTEEPEPQQRAARHRVLDYYLHTGFTANRHLNPPRKPITLQAPQPGAIPDPITGYGQATNWLTAEHAVLLSATNYAAVHGFDTHAWQLPSILATFLHRRRHLHDLIAMQQTAVAAAERLGDPTALAITHRELGAACTWLGRHTEAQTYLQQALHLHQGLDDREGQARTHLSLSSNYDRQGRYTKALIHDQNALDLYRAIGDRTGEARAFNYLGWDHALLKNYQQALNDCQQALNIFRDLGDRYGEAHTLDSLGYVHHHLGQYTQAVTCYQDSIALFRELSDHYYEAQALMKLGDTHRTTGDVAAARDVWQQALVIFDQLDHSDAETIHAKLATLDTDPDELSSGDQQV